MGKQSGKSEAQGHTSNSEPSGGSAKWVAGLAVVLAATGGSWYLLQEQSEVAPMGSAPILHLAGVQVSPDMAQVTSLPVLEDLSDCSLLLVTLDTTSPNHIACYGNENIATPTLDRLAAEGVIFSAATAVSPLTLPSHTSILTGMYPSSHGVRTNGFFHLKNSQVTLAERLQSAGFRTGAIPAAFVLDSQFGLAQGFETYDDDLEGAEQGHDDHNPSRRADHTTDRAITWLRNNSSGRFFLWVHYFDPHYVYAPPSPFSERYADAPYDGEIAFVDSELGRLMDSMEKLGVADNCLTVVVGDHGEGLGEHNEPTHAYQVYGSTIGIPLIMHSGSRLGGGVHCPLPVSQVDVMPTVLSLLGLGPGDSDGVDLTAPLSSNRPVFFETLAGTLEYGWEPLVGTLMGTHKYIHSSAPELFDLAQDPGELRNLFSTQPDKAAELKHHLHNLFGSELELASQVTPTVQPSSGDLESLQALGYLGGGASDQSASTPQGRPSEMILLLTRVELARNTAMTLEARVAELRAVLKEQPDFYPAWKALGQIYVGEGDLDQGGAALTEALRLSPGTPRDVFGLAAVKQSQGSLDEAMALLAPLLQQYPDYLRARHFYGTILTQQDKWEEAIEHFRFVFERDPNYEDWMNMNQLVGALTKTGEIEQLRNMLKQKLDEDPSATPIRRVFATHLAQSKEDKAAEALLREGLALYPRDTKLIEGLAQLLTGSQDPEVRDLNAAEQLLVPYAAVGAEVPQLMFTLCMIYGQTGRIQEAVQLAQRARAIALKNGDLGLVRAIDQRLGK